MLQSNMCSALRSGHGSCMTLRRPDDPKAEDTSVVAAATTTVNRLGIRPGLRRGDFKRVAQGGFGDGLNAYAHSMAWFNGRLYVGTTRGNFPLMKARLPIGMDVWPVECPEVPFDLDLRAEIWRYAPRDDRWERVFKAPTIIGSHGKPIPREFGLRGMLVYAAAPISRRPCSSPPGRRPAVPGPLVLRSEDGRHFESTCEPGLTGLPVTSIRTITQFKGRMFTTPPARAAATRTSRRTRWSTRAQRPGARRLGAGERLRLRRCEQQDDLRDGGLRRPSLRRHLQSRGLPGLAQHLRGRAALCLREDHRQGRVPRQAEPVRPQHGDLQGRPLRRQRHPGRRRRHPERIGPAPPELIRIHPDGSWDLLVGDSRDTPEGRKECLSGYLPGFDNFFNGYFWRLCEHDGWLYVSTFEWSSVLGYANRRRWPQTFTNIVNHVDPQTILDNQSGFDLYRSYDGENWVPVTTNGMDNPYNMGLRTMVSSPHGLFLGTANPYGPKIMPLGGDRYVPNPRGGCEVHFAPDHARLAMRPLRALAAARMARPDGAASRCRPASASRATWPTARIRRNAWTSTCLRAGRPVRSWSSSTAVPGRSATRPNPAVVAAKVAHWLPAGIVVVSVNYRMLPRAGPLQQAGDVARAIAFVQKRAAGWHADATRLVVVGHSSGAHLAALLAADPAWQRPKGPRPGWRPCCSTARRSMSWRSCARRTFRCSTGLRPCRGRLAGAVAVAPAAARPAPLLLVHSGQRPDSAGASQRFAAAVAALGDVRRYMKWRCRMARSTRGSGSTTRTPSGSMPS